MYLVAVLEMSISWYFVYNPNTLGTMVIAPQKTRCRYWVDIREWKSDSWYICINEFDFKLYGPMYLTYDYTCLLKPIQKAGIILLLISIVNDLIDGCHVSIYHT